MNTTRCRLIGTERLQQRRMLSAGPVVISEIMYHPALTDEEVAVGFHENDFEFIELQNNQQSPVALAGISLSGGVSFTFEESWLDPGELVVIVNDRTAFEMRYGSGPRVAGEYQGALKNNGERIVLADSMGKTVLDMNFDDSWYDATDGNGYSLAIVDPEADSTMWSQPAGWKPSTRVGGSPGYSDGTADPRPSQVAAAVVSSRQVTVSWMPPSDNGELVSKYLVYRDDQLLGTTVQTTYSDTSVSPDSRYEFRVAAVRNDGQEDSSVPIVIRIEAVGGDAAFAPGVARGYVQINGQIELSGLVASRRNPNVLWTHNDGPQDYVYAINNEGRHVGDLHLVNAPSLDIEDIAIGPGPVPGVDYLYVGDIGGNNDDRTVVQVFRVPEPAMMWNESNQHPIARSYDIVTLRYPGGKGYNAETLLSDPETGDLYILTKESKSSHVYRAAASQLIASQVSTLELVGQVDVPRPSGGDISPDGKEIIIRNEDLARLYRRADGQSVIEALTAEPLDAPVIGRPDEPNGEGISFSGTNRGYYTISEGTAQPLFFFQRTAPFAAGDANRDGVFDSSDLVQIFAAGEYEDDTSLNSTWAEGDWNGDGEFTTADLVLAFVKGTYKTGPAAKVRPLPVVVDRLFGADSQPSSAGTSFIT